MERILNKRPALLLVHTDPVTRHLLQCILSPCGIVHTADDVLAAVDILQSEPISLLIIGLDLPVVNGIEFVHILRTAPPFSRLPVIAISPSEELSAGLVGTENVEIMREPLDLERLICLVTTGWRFLGKSMAPPTPVPALQVPC